MYALPKCQKVAGSQVARSRVANQRRVRAMDALCAALCIHLERYAAWRLHNAQERAL